MFLKFSGCTASTTIGYVRIHTGVSFEPTAEQRGVFQTYPRYSYSGTQRAFKLYNKLFGYLNFATPRDIAPLLKDNFADVHFEYGSST